MKHRTPLKRLIHLVEYLPITLMRAALTIIPERIAYRTATLLGLMAFHVVRIRRSETMENIEIAFPDLPARERYDIARNAYINITYTFFEMMITDRMIKNFSQRVDFNSRDIIDKHRESGSGIIAVTAHFGSWEMCGASIAMAGYPITAMAKRQANPHVDAFINEQRRRLGMNIITSDAGARQIVTALRRNDIIVLVSDQDAGGKGVFVEFFGRPASTPVGAAAMALRYRAPIIVAMSIREQPGKYRVIVRDVSVNPDDTVQSLVQRYTSVMEAFIREYPEQYFWMHRRWKTKPPASHGAVEAEEDMNRPRLVQS